MARLCTICSHPERSAIEAAILGGESMRRVAPVYGISDTALRRHRKDHLPIMLVQAHQAAEIARADDLLDRVRVLEQKAEMLLASAEQAGDVRTALLAIREARGCLELLAKLLGELDERPQVNLLVNPEWLRVRDLLLDALAPYPEARAAVAGRLGMLEGGHALGR
jgi:transposase-like protein